MSTRTAADFTQVNTRAALLAVVSATEALKNVCGHPSVPPEVREAARIAGWQAWGALNEYDALSTPSGD